jgi:hypothetical protein
MTQNPSSPGGSGLKIYIAKNMLMGVILAVFVIIVVKIVLGFIPPSGTMETATPNRHEPDRMTTSAAVPDAQTDQHAPVSTSDHSTPHMPNTADDHSTDSPKKPHRRPVDEGSPVSKEPGAQQDDPGHFQVVAAVTTTNSAGAEPLATAEYQPSDRAHSVEKQASTTSAPVHETEPLTAAEHQPTKPAHSVEERANTTPAPAHDEAGPRATDDHATAKAESQSFPVAGMAFVDAVIQPLDHELNQRFYGWRPNDILDFTDNVNNFQLGVLEVTRRTAVILSERISRTGSTAAFDKNLENARNWFMIKADRYWFPSAESKYRASLKEIRTYFHRLERGEAQIFTRTDNLIPLLMAYEDLLGSCDENLVKSTEDDGSPVSFFKSDDYFFYAKGVASTMYTVLKGIEKDFSIMVSREGGMEVLHHAIESCHHAMGVKPWIVLNSDLSSILANHRLNMAAPISHARFYLGVLIKALST